MNGKQIHMCFIDICTEYCACAVCQQAKLLCYTNILVLQYISNRS